MTLPVIDRFRQTGQVSSADGLEELADRLYALPPADFVATRDDAVRAARAEGDRAYAASIAKLRRPTVAAWLVNLLALRRPELIEELFALGAELRAAQHDLRGPALRELANRRRTAVGALVSEAGDLAVESGAVRSGLPVADVETTLIAALADDALADAVRAGRVLKSGHYDGFGEPNRPHLQVIEGGDGDQASAAEPVAKTRLKAVDSAPPQRPASVPRPEEPVAVPSIAGGKRTGRLGQRPGADESRKRLAEATATLAEAEAAYEAAVETVDRRSREVTDIEEQLTALRRARVAAHSALLDAQNAQDSMDAERHAARRRFAAAERAAKRT